MYRGPAVCTKMEVTRDGYIIMPLGNKQKRNDDVFFYHAQQPMISSLSDALRAVCAYDLFGPQEITLIMRTALEVDKYKIGPYHGNVSLPYSMDASQVVLVFAEGEQAEAARKAGADIVGGLELIKQVEEGELVFDHALCTLDFLPNIKHMPRILKQKMPNTRRGTATNDIASILPNYKSSSKFVCDRHGDIHQTIGDTSFSLEQLEANITALIKEVDKYKHKEVESTEFFTRCHVQLSHVTVQADLNDTVQKVFNLD